MPFYYETTLFRGGASPKSWEGQNQIKRTKTQAHFRPEGSTWQRLVNIWKVRSPIPLDSPKQ